jgi:hypothetical protein
MNHKSVRIIDVGNINDAENVGEIANPTKKLLSPTNKNYNSTISQNSSKDEKVLLVKMSYNSTQQTANIIVQPLKIHHCQFCNHKSTIVFDLENHYFEYPKKQLKKILGLDIDIANEYLIDKNIGS